MSNRFDPPHKLSSKQDAVIGPVASVGNEMITGGDRRRRWSSVDKASIVRESLQPGAVASEVAKRHGVNRWQLYVWRRQARAASGGSAGPGDQAVRARPKRNGPKSPRKTDRDLPAFAPVVMATPAIALQPTAPEAGLVEIAIGGVSVRVKGAVDVEGLAAVLNAVRRMS